MRGPTPNERPSTTDYNIAPDTIRAMRDTNFTGGTIGGARFIRCGRKLAPGGASKMAAEIAVATGDDCGLIVAAHNPEFAENDYLRIDVSSRAYAFICHLKS